MATFVASVATTIASAATIIASGALKIVVTGSAGSVIRKAAASTMKPPPRVPYNIRVSSQYLNALALTIVVKQLPKILGYSVEADDVIGTLACTAAAKGLQVLISTGDKDMAQLVDAHVTLINTMSNTVLDRDGVKRKFDVWPEQIIDYLALVGDSSDNIPGIDKVGPKTAAKWLGQYETVDAIVAHAADIPGKVGENLRAGLDTLELARKLATIRTDVEARTTPGDRREARSYAELLPVALIVDPKRTSVASLR